ncbi:cytochrome B [Labrys okinawensis]|uniref:Cytochrome B n=1 Tax=Labrys okinawensis TaxID=346911 RepID=A0A2S9Q8M2_9HYPH|nr:cytochrome b [Labrys okinawensis]PRH85634.1 cytochrome B [Labrys okinawensis]
MPSATYRPVQKVLHWTIFLLVLACYGLTYSGLLFAKGDPGRALAWWSHISLGLLLATLIAARLVARLTLGTPPLPSTMSGMEIAAAKGAHFLLYALMIGIVGLGIALAWLRGDALTFFGLFTIPAPMVPDRDLAHWVQEVHELCADAILVMAGLHAAAALWHHYVRGDDVLTRMLPVRSAR